MKKVISLILIVTCGISTAKQYPDLPLDKVLSQEEQKKIGIAKLNSVEKEKLRILIIEKYMAGFEAGKTKGIEYAGKHPVASSSVIESQIDGVYEGWEGETIVKLMNGQIWQQIEYHYHYHYAFMPNVLIYKSGGGYKMKVDGVDKAVGVTLLK